jgi:RimJ/RimL family protein N-acetyltransferase
MLKFETMSDADFAAYLRKAIPEYAYDQLRAGNWTADEAVGRARAEFQQMLPNGPQTPNQHLYTILDAQGHKAGMFWYFVNADRPRKTAFLIDFFIFPESRQKGYEAEALTLFEADARQFEVERVELQVFSHKPEQLALYREAGYGETSVFFAKELKPNSTGI